jgi:hypothetical protein
MSQHQMSQHLSAVRFTGAGLLRTTAFGHTR